MGRITVAPPFAVALCLLAIDAGAFASAWIAVATLRTRTIGDDLGVERGLAGEVGCRGAPQITAVR